MTDVYFIQNKPEYCCNNDFYDVLASYDKKHAIAVESFSVLSMSRAITLFVIGLYD